MGEKHSVLDHECIEPLSTGSLDYNMSIARPQRYRGIGRFEIASLSNYRSSMKSDSYNLQQVFQYPSRQKPHLICPLLV